MAFCGQCGTKFEDGAKFCPSCGAPTSSAPQAAAPTPQPAAKTVPSPQPTATTTIPTADAKDAQDNKVMAVLAYFGPLVLIPIFAAKDSRFARYHSNQGLVLFIALVAYNILAGILNSILLAISWRLYFLTSIISLVSIVFTVLAVIGLINALKGEMKPLPVIGNIRILK